MTRKDEFGNIIGDTQQRGSRGVLGLPPPPPEPSRVSDGSAPAYERQIVSVYDARPIGSYDGFLNPALLYYNFGGGIAVEERGAVTPPGYITVIRTVQYECDPGFVATSSFNWRLRIGGITQNNWVWRVGPIQGGLRSVDTFIVVPPSTEVVAIPDFNPAIFLPLPLLPFIGFNMQCNFILDANEPPNEQIATMPPTVRVGAPPERYK